MKNLSSTGIIISAVVLGFLLKNHFVSLSFSQLNGNDLNIVSFSEFRLFHLHFYFVLTIGLVPILYFTLKKLTKFEFWYKGFSSIAIIILCGLINWKLRILYLNLQLNDIYHETISANVCNFEQYLCIGFIEGSIISYFLFSKRPS